MDNEQFTEKQKQVLRTIEQWIARYGKTPSYREIRLVTGQSIFNIQYTVAKLIRYGYLVQHKGKHYERNFRLTGKQFDWSKERK